MNEKSPPQAPAIPPATTAPESPRAAPDARESWRSEELLGERTEVQILHGTEVYRLRRTRQGKLILYK
jgi:hemin uptake protein HemP